MLLELAQNPRDHLLPAFRPHLFDCLVDLEQSVIKVDLLVRQRVHVEVRQLAQYQLELALEDSLVAWHRGDWVQADAAIRPGGCLSLTLGLDKLSGLRVRG